jgi:hypothetical protein
MTTPYTASMDVGGAMDTMVRGRCSLSVKEVIS